VINPPRIATPPLRQPVNDKLRIVQARKPGSRPYLSLNILKARQTPEADRKAKAFLRRMKPNHPVLQNDDRPIYRPGAGSKLPCQCSTIDDATDERTDSTAHPRLRDWTLALA
jgi:hypothetical protein